MHHVPSCLHRASRPLDSVLRALQYVFWRVPDGTCRLHRAWCRMVYVQRGMRRVSCDADNGTRRMSRVIWALHRAEGMTSGVACSVPAAPGATHHAPRIPSSAWRRRARGL